GGLRRRSIGPRLPQSTTAALPRVVLVLPCFTAGIAWLGDHIPTPQLVASSDVERGDPSTRLSVTGAVGDDDLAVGGDRRREESLPAAEFIRLRDPLAPEDF